MKFSVIIPLYNGAKSIVATLDSVLAQTYTDYEIVLVNDESPDNVGEVVKKYIASHSEVSFVYVEQKNKGLGGARNTAIKHASGSIIAILDQDDFWYPDKLAVVHKVFEEDNEADVVCHNCYIRWNGKIIGVYRTGPYEVDMHRKMLFGGNRLATPATCFKHEVLAKVGDFTEDVARLHFVEDYDFWLRLTLAGFKFHFIPDVLAEYVQHDSNYSLNSIERMCKSELNMLDDHFRLLKNRTVLDVFRLRRRKAKLLLFASYRLLFSKFSLFKGFKFLGRSLFSDPRIIFYIPHKVAKKGLKLLFSKGEDT